MIVNNPLVKEELCRRLRKIEGQVRGVQKMVDEGRDCLDILQQLSAARSAIQSASLIFIQQVAADCANSLDASDPSTRTNMIDDLVTLLGKAA